jgi:hypothetical protein
MATAMAWGELDLPRPAWRSEVEVLAMQVASNTQVIQGNLWIRLTAEITAIEDKLKGSLTSEERRKLIRTLAIKQLQLREVEKNLK